MKQLPRTHEQTIEGLLDAAGKVLEATYEDEQRTRQAITSLERLRATVEEKIGALSRDTVKVIEGASDTTATQAARLLQEKFVEADVAAERARARYVRATQGLAWRLFGLAVLMQLLIFAGVWVIVARTLPSRDEISGRRQVLDQLAQQVSSEQTQLAELDRQIKTKQRKVSDLDRRGARVEWTTCTDSEQVSHLCFRADEEVGGIPSRDGDKTYRVPSGY